MMSRSFPGLRLSLVDTGLGELQSAILGAPAAPAAAALPNTVIVMASPLSSFPGASQPIPRSLGRIFTYGILELLHEPGTSRPMYTQRGPTSIQQVGYRDMIENSFDVPLRVDRFMIRGGTT